MKKKLLLLKVAIALCVNVSFLQAQTDVTNTYLVNPSFEYSANGVNFTGKTDVSTGLYGWVVPDMGTTFRDIQVCNNTDNASAFGKLVTPSDGNFYYFNRKGWTSGTYALTQTSTVTLPVGKYFLSVDYKAAESTGSTTTYGASALDVTVSSGGTTLSSTGLEVVSAYFTGTTAATTGATYFNTSPWKTKGVWFTITTPQTITVAFNQKLVGTNSRADMILDNVKLTQWSTVDADNYDLASATNPLNMTNKITNTDFSTNVTGWTSTLAYQNSARATNQLAAFSGYFFENWNGTAKTGKVYQTITGLPDGIYELKAAVSGNNETASTAALYLYANTKDVAVTSATPAFYTVQTTVVGGSLEIGMNNKVATSNWIGIDNISLKYLGFDPTSAIAGLNSLVTNANAITGHMQTAVQTELTNAVSAANAAITAATKAALTAATTRLTNAITAANASVAAYSALQATITSANTLLTASVSTATGYTVFSNAVTAATNSYNSDLDVTALATAKATLTLAMRTFQVANASTSAPLDVTSWLVNPSFETGDLTGWTLAGSSSDTGVKANSNATYAITNADGNYVFNTWSYGYGLSQTLTVPNGVYQVSALIAHDQGLQATIFANTEQKVATHASDKATGETSTVQVTVIDGQLSLGTKSGDNWYKADNFRLTSMGPVVNPVLNVSATQLFFTEGAPVQTFTVAGTNLSQNISLSVKTAATGVGLDKASITVADASAGNVTVTATFVPANGTTAKDTIIISSGTVLKKIVIVTSKDSQCFVPTYPTKTNLITDPYCNDRSKFGGWGNVAVSNVKAYCGARSMKVYGGSLDASVAGGISLASNTVYRVVAKVYAPTGTSAKFGTFGIGNSSDVDVYSSTTNDQWETADFTFKTASIGTGGVFFQRVSGTDSVYIDNYEIYAVTEPTVRVKYVKSDDVNTTLKDDRIYTPTWGTTLANYLTIGHSYTALTTDKDAIAVSGTNYTYDTSSTDAVTINEGENVIVLKFKADVPTGVDASAANAISVNPTLANGAVKVRTGGVAATIKTFDVAGKLLNSVTVNGDAELSLSNAGVFFVEVSTATAKKMVKVVNVK